MSKIGDLTPERLQELYSVEGLTEGEIAERYGTYQVKVGRLRKKWGIPTKTQGDRAVATLPPIDPYAHQVLIGSLLGDGSMGATSVASARFQEGHSMAQVEYLEWKSGCLKPYVSSTFDIRKDNGAGKVFLGRGFATQSCPLFRPYYDLFYPPPQRIRRFPGSLFREMTPLVLAVWYMDDGHLGSRFHPSIAFGLDTLSLRRAIRGLRRLGLRPEIRGVDTSNMSLTFPGQSDKFFALVTPHVPTCMAYKLPAPSAKRDKDRNAKRLTPSRAKVLYEGGMSMGDISVTYGVGVTTVQRRLDSVGVVPRPMGRVKKVYSREAADVALGNYNPKLWSTLSTEDRERWVEGIHGVLSKVGFPFPTLDESRFQYEVDRLKRLVTTLKDDRIEPWTPVGCGACNPFFPNRFKAIAGRGGSAFEAWHEGDKLRYAIRFQLSQGDPVLPHRVLRAVTMQHRTPSIFRPSVAKFLYQTYCPPGGTVWDPCAGYGGRLLGAYAAAVRYIGTDVEPATVEGNKALAEHLGYEAKLYCQAAESFTPPPVDLVFTSPPYFDRERYSNLDGQSWVAHGSTIDRWVEGFLRPVVKAAKGALTTGGPLIINIADLCVNGKLTVPLVSLTRDVAVGEGFREEGVLRMPLAGLNRVGPTEPVLIFRPV